MLVPTNNVQHGSRISHSAHLLDAALCIALFCSGSLFIWHTSHRITVGVRTAIGGDAWFEADAARVFYNMSARHSDQYRSQVHPIFALIANPACVTFHKLFRLDLNASADLFLALTAGIWMVLMYIVIRQLGFDRGLASMASVLGVLTTSGLFFFSVPETYGLSSVSILATIAIFLFTKGKSRTTVGAILASAASLSMTVTNWSLGLLLTLRKCRFRSWLQISINAFFVITVLWSIEKAIMPSAEFFTGVAGERQYIRRLTPGEVVHTTVVVVSHTVVAPLPIEVSTFGAEEGLIGPVWTKGLSIQSVWPGSGSIAGLVLAGLWLAVLVLGTVTLARTKSDPIGPPVLVFLLLQVLLHLLYGAETILYSLNWMPVLVIVSVYAFQRLGRLRWPAMALFIAFLAYNNFRQFQHVAQIVDSYQKAHPLVPPDRPEQMLPNS
jgi:hypothetical protein